MPLPDHTVRHIRSLRGEYSAVEVGRVHGLSAETIRRIWRREVYVNIPDEAAPDPAEAESLARLNALLRGEAPPNKEPKL